MQYYIIKATLARELGLDKCSRGNGEKGYLVHRGDLVMCEIEGEKENGRLSEVTVSQAKNFIKKL